MIDNQENNFFKVIERNIKSKAKSKGMTITDLAFAIEMTPTGFYKMLEMGSYKVITLKKISDILGVSCSELLGEIPNDTEKRVYSLFKELLKELK